MLVLTRKLDEEVVILDTIGNEIARVRVAALRSDRVRLAVDASLRFGVHRSEVWDRIQAEKAAPSGGELAKKAGAAA